MEDKYRVCPWCKLRVLDDHWRRLKPERTVCQNGHPKTQMVLFN